MFDFVRKIVNCPQLCVVRQLVGLSAAGKNQKLRLNKTSLLPKKLIQIALPLNNSLFLLLT